MNKPRSRRMAKKVKVGDFTIKQIALVRRTVARVLEGKITRDEAQKLLTNSGIPVLKVEGWVHPAERKTT